LRLFSETKLRTKVDTIYKLGYKILLQFYLYLNLIKEFPVKGILSKEI